MRLPQQVTKFWWVWIGIVIVAIMTRFYQLGRVPVGLYWDEAAMMVDLKSVLQTSRDMHGRPWFQVIYPSYGDFKLPIYIWSALLSTRIFGLNEWAFRLPSALAGIGTLIIGGLIAFEFFRPKKGAAIGVWRFARVIQLMTMLVLAVSPWSILFSRTGFEGHLGQLFLALSVWTTLRSRQDWRWLVLTPIFGAIATYSYFAVRFVWIGVFLVLIGWQLWESGTITFKVRKIAWAKVLATVLLPMIFFAVLLLPMFNSPLYGDTNKFRLGTDSVLKNEQQILQSNVYRELAGNTRIDRVLFHRFVLTVRELGKNYADNLAFDFLFFHGDPNLRHGTGQHGLFLWIFLPLLFIGGYVFLTRKPLLAGVIAVWWLAALLPASVPENTPHALRSLNALVPISIVIGAGGAWLILKAEALRHTPTKVFFKIAFSAVFLFAIAQFLFHYFVIYPKASAADWQAGYKQLAQAIYQHQQPGQTAVVVPFDDRFYLWLMLYGPFTGQDFQTWQSRDYKFEQIPGVSFQNVEQSNVTTFKQGTVIFGQPDRLEPVIVSLPSSKYTKTELKSTDGAVRFWKLELQP